MACLISWEGYDYHVIDEKNEGKDIIINLTNLAGQ
jgi:hypothetical protein